MTSPLDRKYLVVRDSTDYPTRPYYVLAPGASTLLGVEEYELLDGLIHGYVDHKKVISFNAADTGWRVYSRFLLREVTLEDATREEHALAEAQRDLRRELHGGKEPPAESPWIMLANAGGQAGPAESEPDVVTAGPGQYL